jgi:hypothetical protein
MKVYYLGCDSLGVSSFATEEEREFSKFHGRYKNIIKGYIWEGESDVTDENLIETLNSFSQP